MTTRSSLDLIETAEHVANELRHLAGERDRTGTLPLDVYRRLRATGLTSALVPSEHGGGGVSHAEMGHILRTLGRADASVAVTLSMHSHLVATQLWRHRHGVDASATFETVTGGALLISTGASDWVNASGRARRTDGGFVVSARKSPASGCEAGDVLVTSIRWADAPEGPQIIHCSIPMGMDGVRIEQTWDAHGIRSSGSHTVVVEDVFVPDDAIGLIRPDGVWHPIWNTILGSALPLIMSAYVGVADRAVDLALEGAAERAGDHVEFLVGEMITSHTRAVDSVDAMFTAAADLTFENSDDHAATTLARKASAARDLIETVHLAVEVLGGRAFTVASEMERLLRDVQGCRFHPLPSAKQRLFTGRVALGRSPIPTLPG